MKITTERKGTRLTNVYHISATCLLRDTIGKETIRQNARQSKRPGRPGIGHIGSIEKVRLLNYKPN